MWLGSRGQGGRGGQVGACLDPMYKEKDYFHPTNGYTGTCNVNANNVNASGVIAGNRASAKDPPLAQGEGKCQVL